MNFPEGQFCGTFPHKMIARLEKTIEDQRLIIEAQNKVIAKWGLVYDLPLDKSENYVTNKVEGDHMDDLKWPSWLGPDI